MKSLNELRADRAALIEKQEALAAKGREEFDNYSDDAKAEFRQAAKENDKAIEALDADISTAEVLERSEQRSVEIAEARKAQATETAQVEVLSEPMIYNPDEDRRLGTGSFKFLIDVAHQKADPGAAERLRRHQSQVDDVLRKSGEEFRDVGTGAFAGLTVPQYLTDKVAEFRQAGRPFANICNPQPLPADGMTVNISRITTASAAAAQATQNSAVQETDMDDTLLTVNVNTYAGMQDVSRQAIDRSVGADQIVLQDLVMSHNTALDAACVWADGTSGTHLGVYATTGVKTVTYTDASPTAGEAYPGIFSLLSQTESAVYLRPDALLMNPRRWWWFASQVGSTFPFIAINGANPQTVQAGSVTQNQYGNGNAGWIAGIPVFTDGNVQTTVSSTYDVLYAVTTSECFLWEEPNAPLRIRTDDTLANQLSVRFVVYSYSAFSAGRYPGAHGYATGSGYTTPAF